MMPAVVGVDAKKLRRLRLSLGLTQIELAKKASVAPGTVVRWEKGEGTKPHPGSLTKIANALGVERADLLES